ncbi:MAG: T9SS type A sorting domain-containing protein [Chitinophagales bacterium]|nr:T9SS type A sorting domain-containing protein [Chitinophagales bacterium]MBP9190567.1 T9SS type A sorting domain-containing protein [Chitinophagales bacterium]MBP9548700.1 T9SS type A sorting domain-containing protein [Chitinophagales bacterium]
MQSSYSFLKIVLLLVVTFCLTFQVNAQSTGFAPEGAEWHYTLRIPFSSDQVYMRIYTDGDTLIDDKECTILRKEKLPSCYGGKPTEYIYEEDSVVYFYDFNFNKFQILYDYTKTTGEFWNVQLPFDTMQVYIDSVDVVEINGVLLRIQYAKYQFTEGPFIGVWFENQIYERIGNTNYLFIYPEEDYFTCDLPYSEGLRCYSDPEFGLYETGEASSCDYTPITTIENHDIIQSFPNPAKDFLYLDINSNDCLSQPTSINLYNALGGLILQNIKTQCGLNAIKVNNLSPGIYYLQCNQNGQIVFSQKVVIE